ncbi:4Fe-4S dicluster domain-containing protein [Candidatus Contubernalis alkaliaceticus]|uniref:4Fe-4S dicluster domain-containing protein n=1 Tax=Candidatus Contubernalis alkaliaceticus TaxID=338645 RepID=UPI001F4BF173|nr:4Fe-4S dicluster domain-containing protein [Candidatus Contubernalis alkalaceticus]UNC92429.1 (2Fe-2S)-binding protein [Candidatus Contubernalis alkalaceticus]
MVSITINGRELKTEKDITLLQLAKSEGIGIPTLCSHKALIPYGACRLCVVEVSKGQKTKIVNSCAYPLREDGISVQTNTPRLKKIRKNILEFLLARCPEVEIIKKMAGAVGVKEKRLPKKKVSNGQKEECILCGLCVRVCNEVIGKEAISFVHRGADREVAAPFYSQSKDCVGCTACAFVCPTGAIKVKESGNKRNIIPWNTEITLVTCEMCGISFAPENSGEYLKTKLNLPAEWLKLCPQCRRKVAAETMGKYDFASRKVFLKR